MGVGAGLLGAAVVALRLRTRPAPQPSLPDVISPAVFARRVQRTTRGQIVYHVSGEGDPVVFLHDLFPGAASYEWSKIYPAFSATHRVLAPDWIGFGESERPDRPLRAEDYAQSLQEFVRATCGGRRPILVGSGLGAALACLASAQHPELASRLTPFGGSIAHGFLTLSMLAQMAYQANPRVAEAKTGVNYGFNKVRFISPVPAGARVRGRFVLKELDTDTPGRCTTTYEVTVEIEGSEKPAIVAEWLGAGLM